MMFTIEEIKDEDQKMSVVAEVLKDLPEWFGIPESTQAYIEGAKDLQVWAAYQESELTGFVSLSYSSEECAEIDCLGVKKAYQGRGIGSQLLATLEREAGKHFEVVDAQIKESLFDLSAEDFGKIVLAYEPVWAIGTGKTASAEQAEEIHAHIRATLAAKYGNTVADDCTILYGGSANAGNAKELFSKPNVDGGLIGGASLAVDKFMPIVEAF